MNKIRDFFCNRPEIVVLFFLIGILISGAFFASQAKKKHPEKYYNVCQIDCKNFGLGYYKYRGDSCWCLKDKLPKQIW